MVTPIGSMIGFWFINNNPNPLYQILPHLAVMVGVLCVVSFVSTRILKLLIN